MQKLQSLLSQPWAMRETELRSYVEAYKPISADRIDEMLGLEAQPIELQVEDGVAIIPVKGPLAKGLAEWEKVFYGYTDVEDISFLFGQAVASADVRAIVLNFDSPGGSVQGIPEFAAKIRAARAIKPIVSYSEGLVCSAAYWLASQAHYLIGSTSSNWGSIGVYTVLYDTSKMYEAEGVRPVLVKAGKEKAIGLDGLPVTEDQVAVIAEGVQYVYGLFTEAVTGARPTTISPDVMQGNDYYAEIAKGHGLIDGVVTDIETAKREALLLA